MTSAIPEPTIDADIGFKLRDAQSYDQLADEFDLLTARYTTPLARRIIRMAAIQEGGRVLDVGCGTGVLTLLAAQAAGGRGRVVGVDLSEGMLAKAGSIAAGSGLVDRIEFARGDAEQLHFSDQSFQTVVSLYALRHFPNPEKALLEMYRCCAKGGRVLVAVGSAPPLFSTAGLRAATRRVGELGKKVLGRASLQAPVHLDGLIEDRLGRGDKGEHAVWTHGIKHFDRNLGEQLRRAGFSQVNVAWLGHAHVINTVEEFWLLQYTLSSFARKRLQTISSDQFEMLRKAFDEGCARQLARGGRLEYRSGALVATAVRAG